MSRSPAGVCPGDRSVGAGPLAEGWETRARLVGAWGDRGLRRRIASFPLSGRDRGVEEEEGSGVPPLTSAPVWEVQDLERGCLPEI